MKIFLVPSILSVSPLFWRGTLANPETFAIPDFPIRSYDGTDRFDGSGKANSPLHRLVSKVDVDLSDGANPRTVSNLMSTQPADYDENKRKLSDITWQWGQFIDHDFALTSHTTGDHVPITVPQNDTNDVLVRGNCQTIPFTRTDTDADGEQLNLITAFIDGSMVYGSDAERAMALRSKKDGKMLVSTGDLLPLNTLGLEMAEGIHATHFAAGDVRANEQLGLTAMHTLFVREHNRLAERIKNIGYENADDETIYQLARHFVIDEIQIITYKEFLPAILGSKAPLLQEYVFSNDTIPQMSNEFSTVFFRFGHSMLSEGFRLDNGRDEPDTIVELREAFFNPDFFTGDPENVDHIIRGLVKNKAQEIDCKIIEDVRSFLFSDNGESTNCLDLGALNIQRGRDHGIPKYNALRVAMGLQPANDFSDVSSDQETQDALKESYETVDDIDAWMGALAEDHLSGASVGELMAEGIAQEFTRLRDGDPFFHRRGEKHHLVPRMSEIIDLDRISLKYIIEKNLDVRVDSNSVFFNDNLFQRDSERGSDSERRSDSRRSDSRRSGSRNDQ